MKKCILFLLGIFLMTFGQIKAQTVSMSDARAKAVAFLSNGAKKLPARKGVHRVAPGLQNVELAYTSEKGGKTCFYVFNNGDDGGFIIIGGDAASKEILAYSDKGHFDYDSIPDNFKNMLEQYAEQISLAEPAAQGKVAKAPAKAESTGVKKEDIADLITTTWGQSDPYNRAIPKLVSSVDGKEYAPPVGYDFIASSQVMKYWNYPEHGFGSIEYTVDYNEVNAYSLGDGNSSPEFGSITHKIDFQNTYYDWANMLDSYTGKETEEQIKAVSTLAYHAGGCLHTIYGVNQTSGANVIGGLQKYFGYSPKAITVCRDSFDNQTWEELIYTELKLGRPVIYEGNNGNYYKTFIAHGYSSEFDMYAINWGNGGWLDCYCKLTPVDEGSTLLGYENQQTAVLRLQPATKDSDDDLDYGDIFWADGFKWKIISPVFNTVELERPNDDEPWYSSTDITVPATVNYSGKEYTVISLGDWVFSKTGLSSESDPSVPKIEKVSLPESLRIIREFAFSGCPIDSIIIPNHVAILETACFELCSYLSFVDLPASLEKINESVFYTGSAINVIICRSTSPSSITTLNTGYNAPFLKNTDGFLLVPEEAIEAYKNSHFWNEWNIYPIESTDISSIGKTVSFSNGMDFKIYPSGAELLYMPAFDPEAEVTVPEVITVNGKDVKVVCIGKNSFSGAVCKSVVLPESITTIKSFAFSSCSAESINLPESITTIEYYAFSSSGITSLSWPSSIEVIPWDCFNGCTSLYEVTLPQNLKSISTGAFCGCEQLTTINIPDNMTDFDYQTFYGCSKLTSLNFPDSLRIVSDGCFDGTGIEHFILPEGVKFVYQPLENMGSLREVVYPSTVELMTWQDIRFGTAEKAYMLFPGFADVSSVVGSNTTVYVPDEYLEKCKGNNWDVKEILPVIPVTSMTLDKSELQIDKGDKETLNFTLSPADASLKYVKWYSSDPSVASVDNNGVVSALNGGTATITAKCMYYPDLVQNCTVTVTNADGINDIQSAGTAESIYSLDGKKVTKMQHGIYIVRTSDGMAKKVAVK